MRKADEDGIVLVECTVLGTPGDYGRYQSWCPGGRLESKGVDRVREKNTRKRGGRREWLPLAAHTEESGSEDHAGTGCGYDLLDANENLEELDEVDPELVEVMELWYSGGPTGTGTTEILEGLD